MSNYHHKDIASLLDKVRLFETSIGELRSFSIVADGRCELVLSNGTLFFLPEELEAQATTSLTPEIVHAIAGRFHHRSASLHRSRKDRYAADRRRSKRNNALYLFLGAASVCMAAGLFFYTSAADGAKDADRKRRPQLEDALQKREAEPFERESRQHTNTNR